MNLHGPGYFFLKLLVSPALMGSIFLIVGAIFSRFPANTINMYYGYRTRKSMLNQDTWNVANTFSGILMKRIGVVSILIGIIISLASSSIGFVAIANVVLTIASAILLVVLTERKLDEEFDKDGIRKNKDNR
jgi:uncharacterized membrane protein